MALPTGQISMSQVSVELGLSSTATISLNQANVRTLAGVPSGAISLQNLRGKSNTLTVQYLVIAGGGSGGQGEPNGHGGGGGGGGGYRSSVPGQLSGKNSSAEAQLTLNRGSHTVTIGAGGAVPASRREGFQGGNSTFATITSTGGGRGSTYFFGAATVGGSGGGGAVTNNSANRVGQAGIAGQGFAGGSAEGNAFGSYGGAGGGAGGAGTGGNSSAGRSPGVSSNITGTAVTRGQGGAAGFNRGNAGAVNTGQGGGGGAGGSNARAGGSGLVVVRYSGAQQATGGTITSFDGFTIHTFTGSGTFTF